MPVKMRIVAVADASDAMTHSRPYKPAFSLEHAVAEIRACRGSQLDPQVADAFVALEHDGLIDRSQQAPPRG